MSDSILIQGGRIVDPSRKRDSEGDLLIEDGKVSAIDHPGKIPAKKASKVISAKGRFVLPGLIDMHVHLREPGLEYKETIETGTRAAVAGGFTSVACMANTQPVNDTPYVTAFIRERAKATASCRVFPIGALSKGLKGEELAEIGGMVSEGARAISDDGMPVMNSYLMRKAMDYAKAFDVPIISHAEDGNLVGQGSMNEGALSNELGIRGNPAAAEEIMVAREIALCRLTRARVHIAHVSTAVALEHIRRAKEDGLPVTAEVCPHHLTLTEDAVKTYDTCCKMAPPLRTAEDVEALWKALADGTIDVIATDHAPHGLIDKAVEFDQAANGIIGLQSALPLTFKLVDDGKVKLARWVESLSSGPARVLGLKLGTLEKGWDADVTIFDPQAKWVFSEDKILSKSANSPFVNWDLKGRAVATIVGGRVAYACAGYAGVGSAEEMN
ncbi:MAG TPA: dihydroorotase [Bdellovibrionota bacterium]|nr:dihydroorotase [Bdellovibrionota bacterium]